MTPEEWASVKAEVPLVHLLTALGLSPVEVPSWEDLEEELIDWPEEDVRAALAGE